MFITFEGPEGSGKTTHVQALSVFLRQQGYPDVVVTREPGGTAIGDQIREILLDFHNQAIRPETEVLLFSASRAQLVREVIQPALARGAIVICDRFADSTLAYQGYGYGLDLEALQVITRFATQGLVPDLTIYLDIDVAAGLQRKRAVRQRDTRAWNRLDQQTLDFHQRVRAGYLELVALEPARWLVVDAARPLSEIQQEIFEQVLARLRARGDAAGSEAGWGKENQTQ